MTHRQRKTLHLKTDRSAFTGSAIEFVDGQVDGQGQAESWAQFFVPVFSSIRLTYVR